MGTKRGKRGPQGGSSMEDSHIPGLRSRTQEKGPTLTWRTKTVARRQISVRAEITFKRDSVIHLKRTTPRIREKRERGEPNRNKNSRRTAIRTHWIKRWQDQCTRGNVRRGGEVSQRFRIQHTGQKEGVERRECARKEPGGLSCGRGRPIV